MKNITNQGLLPIHRSADLPELTYAVEQKRIGAVAGGKRSVPDRHRFSPTPFPR